MSGSRKGRERGWTRIGAYAICVDNAQRLLVCRIAPGYPLAGSWTLPGGGVEFGEHPNTAVLREPTEETGLTGTITDIAWINSFVVERPMSRPGPLHGVSILFRVEVTAADLRTELDGSTDQCAWLHPDELATGPRTPLIDTCLELLSPRASTAVRPD